MALQRLTMATAALVALALGACNHEAPTARLDAAAVPAPAPHAQLLAFSDDGANAKLASSAAMDGGPGLVLECEHGGRTVHVTQVGGGPRASRLVLDASGVRSTLPAQAEAFEGRRLLVAEAPVDSPALQAFRKSATLRVEDGVQTLSAATADGPAGAERFFAACG